jgi:hypothetical protein
LWGVALIKRFDGEIPKIYLQDCLENLDITEQIFFDVIDEF